MPTATFLQYGPLAGTALDTLSDKSTIQEAARTIQRSPTPRGFFAGSVIQDNKTLQIISEGSKADDPTSKSFTDEETASVLGVPLQGSFSIEFNESLFRSGGPATSNVIEFVQSYFPVSQLTPEFKDRIEQDFKEFNSALVADKTKGRGSLNFGWTIEELEHPEIKGEKAKAFTVVAGWDSMEDFEASLQSEAFKKVIGIIYAWGAPYKMWHSERKAVIWMQRHLYA